MPYHSLCAVAVVCLSAVCSPEPVASPAEPRVSRDEAIEIARQEVEFEPDSVQALHTESDGRSVWRVTFTATLPNQPPGLSETVIVEVDADSGVIVSIARS